MRNRIRDIYSTLPSAFVQELNARRSEDNRRGMALFHTGATPRVMQFTVPDRTGECNWTVVAIFIGPVKVLMLDRWITS